jgi:hypothetical protein
VYVYVSGILPLKQEDESLIMEMTTNLTKNIGCKKRTSMSRSEWLSKDLCCGLRCGNKREFSYKYSVLKIVSTNQFD